MIFTLKILEGVEKKSMWIEHTLLGAFGFICGIAVAGGTFALIVGISVAPRITFMSKTAKEVMYYENIIILGGILGNIVTVFPKLPIPFGSPMLVLFGLGCGVQVGCLVMALAEIMNVFPIMFRRLRLKIGMSVVITAMAAGKVVGGLWYFFQGIGE